MILLNDLLFTNKYTYGTNRCLNLGPYRTNKYIKIKKKCPMSNGIGRISLFKLKMTYKCLNLLLDYQNGTY